MAIVEVSDFTGRYLLAKTTYNVGEIQDYIDRFVPSAIAALLGAELAAEFIQDVEDNGGSVPSLPEFVAIFNPLMFDSCGEAYVSEGMKTYLMSMVYWWFTVENRVRPSAAGGSGQPKGENSSSGNRPAAEHYQRYNAGIATAKAIQAYIEKNCDLYPKYNGQALLYNSSIL